MFRGAARSIPSPSPKNANWSSPAGISIPLKSTARSIHCKAPPASERGTTRPPMISSFPQKAADISRTCCAFRDIKVPLGNFFASGILLLGEKLGPILWQFPPNFALDLERFEEFFALLPTNTEAAAELAKRHHEKLRLGVWTKTDARRPLRHAVEVRHESFADPAFIALLRKYNVAMVVAETAGKWPMIEDVTADFSYVRLHGDEELYASGYTDAALDRWAAKVDAWHRGSELVDVRTALRQPLANVPRPATCSSISTTT